MSATHDRSQNISFIFTRLKPLPALSEGNNQPEASFVRLGIETNQILKTAEVRAEAPRSYSPLQLLGAQTSKVSIEAAQSLSSNLNQLDEIQARLKFMISELKELTAD